MIAGQLATEWKTGGGEIGGGETGADGAGEGECPARGPGATVSCPLVKGATNIGSRAVKIFRTRVPVPDDRGRCCTNSSSVNAPPLAA